MAEDGKRGVKGEVGVGSGHQEAIRNLELALELGRR
jgi:hypothetical protein